MSNQNDASGEFSSLLMILLVFVITLYFGWIKYGHYITNISVLSAVYLIQLTNSIYALLPDSGTTDSIFFFFVSEAIITDQETVIHTLRKLNTYSPTFSDAHIILTVFGHFLRFPILFFGLWGSYIVYHNSKPSRLNRKFDIYSLAEYSKKYFPQIRPALIANLLKTSFDEGPHRQEDGPIRFAILNNTITAEIEGVDYAVRFGKGLKINKRKKIYYVMDNYDEDEGLPVIHGKCRIDIKPIRTKFVEQITHLGRWTNANDLPPYARALYAVFLLFIKGGEKNKQRGLDLLEQYNATFKADRKQRKDLSFDTSGIDEVIAEFDGSIAVNNVIKKHTYVSTVLAALYFRATHRKSKLPPNKFYWLKEVNRTLWYALHQNLSPSAWTEAGGNRGIVLTEQKLQQKSNYPFTDNAIRGFIEYINYEGWLIEQPDNLKELVQ